MLSDEVVIFESLDIRHSCQHIFYCILIIVLFFNYWNMNSHNYTCIQFYLTLHWTEKKIFYFLCEKKLHWNVLSEKKIYNDKVYNIICNKNEIFYNFSHCLILALNLTCTTLSIYKLNFFCARLVSLLLIFLTWCGVFQTIFGRRVWSVQGNCKAL